MTPLAAAGLGAVTAACLGPAAIAVARREAHSTWRPGTVETSAIVTIAGLIGAHAVAASRVLLGPLIVLGLVAAVVDAHEARLPDHLTGPTLLATVGLCLATAGPAPVVAALAVGAVLVVVKWISTDAIGWGDVKLAPSIVIVMTASTSSVPGLLLVVVLIALTACAFIRDRSSVVPFGPALVIGAVFAST